MKKAPSLYFPMMRSFDQEMNTMQSAKMTGTMPHILILPPGGKTNSKTEAKSECEEKQQVTGKKATNSLPRHANCDHYSQTEENENKED